MLHARLFSLLISVRYLVVVVVRSLQIDKDSGFMTRNILCEPIKVRMPCIGKMAYGALKLSSTLVFRNLSTIHTCRHHRRVEDMLATLNGIQLAPHEARRKSCFATLVRRNSGSFRARLESMRNLRTVKSLPHAAPRALLQKLFLCFPMYPPHKHTSYPLLADR